MIKLIEYKFRLTISNSAIVKISNGYSNEVVERFEYPLTSDHYKIYVLSSNKTIHYIGTTKDSIKNRIRNGLKANGKNGYHGYKWRNLPFVNLSVWVFEELDKEQIENIEAELAFIVRLKTKRWPDFQNEIHFNNSFVPTGQLLAEKIYQQLTQ
jgi:hypothetical protein